MMKQAQALQKEITKIKSDIDNSEFVGKSSLVSVRVKGTKEVIEISFSDGAKDLANDDISMLGDMIVLAINDAFSKVDKETELKMGKYSSLMNGIM